MVLLPIKSSGKTDSLGIGLHLYLFSGLLRRLTLSDRPLLSIKALVLFSNLRFVMLSLKCATDLNELKRKPKEYVIVMATTWMEEVCWSASSVLSRKPFLFLQWRDHERSSEEEMDKETDESERANFAKPEQGPRKKQPAIRGKQNVQNEAAS